MMHKKPSLFSSMLCGKRANKCLTQRWDDWVLVIYFWWSFKNRISISFSPSFLKIWDALLQEMNSQRQRRFARWLRWVLISRWTSALCFTSSLTRCVFQLSPFWLPYFKHPVLICLSLLPINISFRSLFHLRNGKKTIVNDFMYTSHLVYACMMRSTHINLINGKGEVGEAFMAFWNAIFISFSQAFSSL